ncbi:MAG: nickel-dependent lactate racemase [Candidatus Cloacimonetes bacterium]|nr:nickel-dependent lactate racemase [Candidatus Cloacimonadota bacterium]
MRKNDIKYGEKKYLINFPQTFKVHIIEPESSKKIDNSYLVENSLQNPLNSPSLLEFIESIKNLLIIVNDTARSTPTEKILKIILPSLQKTKYKIIIATGTHKVDFKKDLPKIFGALYKEVKDFVIVHNSKNDEMTYLGTTTFDNDIYLNKCIEDFEGIVVIGSVEPHYFAGFTGGRKSFLPGIAAYITIEKNHSFALNDKKSKIAILDENPVHEDMLEAISFIKKPIFSIQTVLDTEQNVIFASSGNIYDSFDKAVEFSRKYFIKKVSFKADIIVAEIETPFDKSLYQAHKGLENCKSVLKNNGIYILVAKCKDGLGSSNFVDLLKFANSLEELISFTKKEYKLGYHKSNRIAKFLLQNKLWLVSDLPDDIVTDIYMRNFHSVQEAIDSAIIIKGEKTKILIIKNAATVIPV